MEESSKQIIDNKRKRKPLGSFNNELETGKIPPQAIELEEAILGAMMLEKDPLSTVIDILRPEVFYLEKHQAIFKAINQLFHSSQPVDSLTVVEQLKKNGDIELVGGPYYIAHLTNKVASAANIEFHSRIVIEKYLQRELVRISRETLDDAYDQTTDVLNLLDRTEQKLFEVTEKNIRKKTEDMASLISMSIKQIETASQHEDHISGVPTGFSELDRVTAGWQKSDLIILAARPGMGKTAFVLSMTRNMAIDFKRPIAVFSLEMSATQLVTRLIASESGISADKLKKGNLDAEEWNILHSEISKLAEAPIYIDDTPALSIFELRAKCRRLKQKHDVQVIIIDYLQLMSSGNEKSGNRVEEISQISRSLKSLAKELNVPVICLSQLSRAVETRTGHKRPILSDLRESGAIEQDADMVMFIYRPEYYKFDTFEDGNTAQGIAEIIIAKHRNGGLENIKLRFIDKLAKFTNIEYSDFKFPEIEPNIPSDMQRTMTVQSKMNNDTDFF
ncbi:MAG: replicative DNA helicase [Bacteroidota bacterium]